MANKLRRVWNKSSVDVPHRCERERYCLIYEKNGDHSGSTKQAPRRVSVEACAGTASGTSGWRHTTRFPSLDDGEFHRVDIGALGTVTAKLTGELEAARKELVEQRQATQTPEQT